MTEYLAAIAPALFLAWAGYFFYSRGASGGRAGPSNSRPQSAGAPRDTKLSRVLILTAAVGGGHEEAGRTVWSELERSGCSVAVKDGLRTMSRPLSWLLNQGYCNQVRNTPKTLGAIFAVTSRRTGATAVRIAVSLLFANRLLRAVRRERPDLVVSTYPLVNAALGYLRRSGRLRVPAAAIIADYGVHPLWVAPNLDLHLVVSRHSSGLAEHAGGLASVVRMPVAPGFYSAPTRDEARATLGLPQRAFVALIVGGAWGIGNLGEATKCAAESGVHTLVVTGNNAKLKARLEERFGCEERVRILGWREDMPVLMTAADCLIQNAGGMTCIEAIEMGLPILIFDPILGHGELNAKVMELVGVARQVGTAEELKALLRSAARRETSLLAPSRELAAPTVSTVLESLAVGVVPEPARTRWPLSPRPVLAGVSLLAFVFWLAFAPMGMAVAAKGFHTHIPGYNPSPGKIALGVRVTDPATAVDLENSIQREGIPVTIFADAQAAENLHPAGRITFGVAEEPGNKGAILPWRIRREAQNTAVEIQHQTGAQPEYFLPALRTNLTSLAEAPPHTEPVVPEWTKQGEPPSGLLIVDTSGLSPGAARLKLARTLHDIRAKDLRCVPLAEL